MKLLYDPKGDGPNLRFLIDTSGPQPRLFGKEQAFPAQVNLVTAPSFFGFLNLFFVGYPQSFLSPSYGRIHLCPPSYVVCQNVSH